VESAVSKKSGKGLRDGVISEPTTYWDVRPGHEEQLRRGSPGGGTS
jgi:hypothetical protein